MESKLFEEELTEIVFNFLEEKRENEFFDIKRRWHIKMDDLIKDIICFTNVAHDKPTYLIFGVDDETFKIIGVKENERKKQADIIDAMSTLHFATSERPSFKVETLNIDGKIVDVMIIDNKQNTPIFLEKKYGKMNAGCIYSRTKDRNTPNNGNSTFTEIEGLWRKRFGLIKPKKEFMFELIKNKSEWNELYPEYYHVFLPEYRILKTEEDNDRDRDGFYSYAVTNQITSYYTIELFYNSNKLDRFYGMYLDSGRLFIPIPSWGFVHDLKFLTNNTICRYKYYIKGSEEYELLNFFYDSTNHEQRYAMNSVLEIFLIYESELERIRFEKYIENNIDQLEEVKDSIEQYDYVKSPEGAENHLKLENYRKDLKYALAMNKLLKEWRKD